MCKLWQSIISETYFRVTHTGRRDPHTIFGLIIMYVSGIERLYRHLNRSSLIVYYNISCIRGHIMRITGLKTVYISIISSCNGLLLYSASFGGINQDVLYLYNPLTWDIKQISKPESIKYCDIILTCDHRIICFEHNKHGYYQIMIYSYETCLWEPCGMPGNTRGQFLEWVFRRWGDIHVIFWNGAINWVVVYFGKLFLVSFDIETHHLQEKLVSSSTPTRYKTSVTVNLRESEDNLYVFVCNDQFNIEIIKFVKDQLENFVVNHVHLNLISVDGCRLLPFSVMSRQEGEGDQLLVAHGNDILSYNLLNKTCEVFIEDCFVVPIKSSIQVFSYNPTFFFP